MNKIAIFGAGGFGREVACLLKSINDLTKKWDLVGFFDDGLPKGSFNLYGEILGNIDTLNRWGEPLSVVVAIGDPIILEKVVNKVDNPLIDFPNIIASGVQMLDPNSLMMGKGNIIGFGSIISCSVRMGNFNLYNSDSIIGHDTLIGNFNIFNPSVRISGEVTIGNNNFFGVCSVVLQRKKIGNYTTITANSVVMRNTLDNCSYYGNPAVKMNFNL
jgi:sugar O-acyltransferase (sialic acid O-acetyltransferase NeuD family)